MRIRGNLFLRSGDPEAAIDSLSQAARLLPPMLDARLAIEIHHALATAELQVGRPRQAEKSLHQVERYYVSPYGDALLSAQRKRLLGRVYCETERAGEGFGLLAEGISGLIDSGEVRDAFRAMIDLVRAVQRLPPDVSKESRMSSLLQALAERALKDHVGRYELREWLRQLEAHGLSAASVWGSDGDLDVVDEVASVH